MKPISSSLLVLLAVGSLLASPDRALARPRGLAEMALGSVFAAASPNSLGAGWRQQQGEAREAVQSGRAIPLGRVMEIIRRRTPGRPLDAGMEEWNGHGVYRVRWAAEDGRRIDYIVDAESGAILRADGE